MADMRINFRQMLSTKLVQRAALVGRIRLAQAIEMPETEWAKAIADIEKDPLVQELFQARVNGNRVIAYKRYGQTSLSTQFYESQDMNVVGSSAEGPETLLSRKRHLLAFIQKIGQEKFETYFLYRKESLSAAAIATACGLTESEATELQDFVLEMSVNAEFYHPSRLLSEETIKPTMVGQIVANGNQTFSMAFFSPHLARGRYEIRSAELKAWMKEKSLPKDDILRLRKFMNLLEICNLKQNAFFGVLDYLLMAQKDYLETKDETRMAPVSLRQVARILRFAPSTVCRVISTKSLMLPWNHEVYIIHLMPGKRRVVLASLDKILSEKKSDLTDMELSRLLAEKFGLKVSRRTVTTCRHLVLKRQKE